MFAAVGRCQSFSGVRCSSLAHRLSINRLPVKSQHYLTLRFRLHAQRPDQRVLDAETSLLSALTTIGLSGTIAVTGASLCGVQLFNHFQWNQSDILLALELNSALLLVELLLFAPRWSIPASVKASGKQHPASTGNSELVDMSAVKSRSVTTSQSWQLMLALHKAVLRRPQTEQLPQLAIAGLVAAGETSKELLRRGFLLTSLAGWITDRCYEAGLNDFITINSQLSLTLPQLGLWVASIATTAAFAPAAFIAAEEAAEIVSGALLLRTEAGQQLAAARAGSSSSSSSRKKQASSISGSSNPDVHSQQQQQHDWDSDHILQDQQQQQLAEAAAEVIDDDDDDDDDDIILDPDVLEYRLIRITEDCVSSAPTKLAYSVTLTKELARIILANVSYVVTGGNLAATLSCGMVLNGMLLVYAAAATATNDSTEQKKLP